jgi:hypothetical protein
VVHHLHPGDILLHPIGLELILRPIRLEAVDGLLQLTRVVTDPLSDGLLGGVSHSVAARCFECWPLVPTEDFDPRKISMMALNSNCPRCRTSLILYLGAVVMPRCSSRARSLSVGTRASAPKDSTSSISRYIFSFSMLLGGDCSSSNLSST